MQTIFEAASGNDGLCRLAYAWHKRVMADEVMAHGFSRGFHEIAHEQSWLRQIPANIFALRTRGFPHFQLRRGAPMVAAPQKGLNDAVMSSIEGIDTAAFAKSSNGFGNPADVGANSSGAIPRVIEIRLKVECLLQTGKRFGVLKVP
jgi:hypothetical protein